MAVKGFEHYGQVVAPVAPPQATATATTQTQPQATPARLTAPDRLLRGSAYLLILAGALLLAALFDTVHPLVTTITDITVPAFMVLLGGLGAVVWGTMRA